MPRPSSTTVIALSWWIVTAILVENPASASSTELSTTSYTRWCSPRADTDPMYIAGRRRTGVHRGHDLRPHQLQLVHPGARRHPHEQGPVRRHALGLGHRSDLGPD